MLDERKTAILRAIVQEYIRTGQPVGSTHVATSPGVAVSSATVRNEMAVLEQEGYLVQLHTSGGRIPTDRGYRFFVDHLARPGRLDVVAQRSVGEFFDSAFGRLEEMLHRTSDLLARVTHQAALVVGPSADRATVRSVQIVGLSDHHGVLVTVLSNGHVENQPLEFVGPTSEARLNAASAHLQAALVGRTADRARFVPTGDHEVDSLCEAALQAMQPRLGEEPVFVGGASSIAGAFDAAQTVRAVLEALEQQYVVISLVRDMVDRGLAVAIGAEHGVEPLAACSVVLAPVVVDGEHVGTVGVVGPTRMNYPQALATVDVVSQRLARRLGDGT